MKNTAIKIGQRVAKNEGKLGYKLGKVKKIRETLVLVEFDNHPSRWIAINNIETI